MSDMMKNTLQKSKDEGKAEGRAESAMGMLKDKLPLDLIVKYTRLSLEQIQEIAKSIGVAVVM